MTGWSAAGGVPRRPTTPPTMTQNGVGPSWTTGAFSRKSASTILRRRANFRAAFSDFSVARVARFGGRDVTRLLKDAGIVRHRGKIESTVNNARRALELAEEFGSLAAYFWRFEPDPSSRPRRFAKAALLKMSTSAEWGQLPCTPSCRRWDWSTTTSMAATADASACRGYT